MCPYIPLAGHTWDSYLGTLGSSHRANVRRRIKALGQKFSMRFERVTTEAQRSEALAALVAFHERRYVGRGGSTAFMTPALRAFHDEVTRRALDRGWLRLFVLRVDAALVAVMYGFMYNGRFYFYQHGFDEQYQQHSIGLVVMGLSIRAAIDEGADEFDMLWGVEPYKWLWARETRELRKIHLFPPHVGGRIHLGASRARRSLGTLARRMRTITRRETHAA
jgi:CelD/BcsL family acetyltransferase involved in cellulose biosynthesis